nr:MAG TPA: hypothetical protein [Caudoviricetes sp.]
MIYLLLESIIYCDKRISLKSFEKHLIFSNLANIILI